MILKSKSHALVVAGSALWCLAILAAPVFRIPLIYEFFSAICHQQGARSWHLFGAALPVCIRCTSIYFGFFAAALFALRPTTTGLKLAILATLTEFTIAHLFVDSPTVRALTGAALGATAAPFIRIGIEEMLQTLRWKGEVRASL